MSGWNRVQADYGTVPHHSQTNTVGENASDIAPMINAMKLPHRGTFDGFVLVSSDSDLMRLTSRVYDESLDVYGIGQKTPPGAFRKACKHLSFWKISKERQSMTLPLPRHPSPTRFRFWKNTTWMRWSKRMNGSALAAIGQYLNTANPDFDTPLMQRRN